ncbi:MAG: hypothetical protein OET81_04865 [Desulfobacteraceae bacterium]|nr:hypothetical protein [Desulfobacteraceae bacterium]
MAKKSLTIIILLWVSCLLMSCGGLKSIPEGSRTLGVFEGSFDGVRYGGSIRIHLFQTSEGEKLFRATVSVEPNEPTVPRALFVLGKMTANSLEGEFQGDTSGKLSGQLSPVGKQLSGSFDITSPGLNDGTWQAKKI